MSTKVVEATVSQEVSDLVAAMVAAVGLVVAPVVEVDLQMLDLEIPMAVAVGLEVATGWERHKVDTLMVLELRFRRFRSHFLPAALGNQGGSYENCSPTLGHLKVHSLRVLPETVSWIHREVGDLIRNPQMFD